MYNLLLLQGAQGTVLTSEIAAKTTRVAVELNFFDLANIYQYNKSEEVFGEYLKANPGF